MSSGVGRSDGAPVGEVEKVGVIGGGIMGSGIAEVAARSGCDVVLCEVSEVAAENALARVHKSLARAEKSGKLSAADREAAEGRLRTATDVAELADRDLVIEAVIEDEAEKVAIFQALGKVVRPDVLLASNTSSIPIMKLAAVTPQPERVIGMHFFNPVPVLPLVELVPSLLTSPATVERADAFASGQLGKHTVLSKDRAGFVVNALLIPYLLAAIRMVESGFASAEDIDTAMVDGCAHPLGPLALTDLIGLDTTQAVAQSMYAEFKEPLYAPPPLLLRMVEAGLLGRKTGRGFFDYGSGSARA
jgi:3-hydroxybutyryl-CoA dehydrogenase